MLKTFGTLIIGYLLAEVVVYFRSSKRWRKLTVRGNILKQREILVERLMTTTGVYLRECNNKYPDLLLRINDRKIMGDLLKEIQNIDLQLRYL